MELLLIVGLIILSFLNIMWFLLLGEFVKSMDKTYAIIKENAELSIVMANEMIKDKMKENTELKEELKNG